MRLPTDEHWLLGTCIRPINNRSYEGEVGGKRYRRNRRHLRATKELPPTSSVALEYGNSQNEPGQKVNTELSENNQKPPVEKLISQEQNA